jgi:hypothetical protein
MALSACVDAGFTRPEVADQATDAVLRFAVGSRLVGRLTTTVHVLNERGLPERTLAADTAKFTSDVRAGKALFARVATESGAVSTLYGMPDGLTQRQGSWTESSDAAGSKPGRLVSHFSEGGAPISRTEFRIDGELRLKTLTTWIKVVGGWAVLERVTTIFSEGRAVRSISLSFSHEATVAPISENEPKLIADELAATGLGLRTTMAFDCTGYIEAMEDALTAYLAADAALILCLGGPWLCVAAGIAFIAATHNFDVAVSRADNCLNAE